MMRTSFIATAALVSTLITACEPVVAPPPSTPPQPTASPAASSAEGAAASPAEGPAVSPAAGPAASLAGAPSAVFVASNNSFAQRLYGQLAAAPGNLFFSPTSISTALGLAYAGARGQTASEMSNALELTLPPAELHAAFAAQAARLTAPGGPEIRIANRLWTQSGLPIEPDFQAVAQGPYGAGLELVDFKAAPDPSRAKINKWVSDRTNGRITDLLPQGSITPLTRIVLTNAIYFKGTWATQFDKAATRAEPFTVKPGSTVSAPMMHKALRAGYADAGDAQVLELAYAGASPDRAMSMVVILPKAVDGLPKVEQALTSGGLGTYLGGLSPQQVDVSLPRFKVTMEKSLRETLEAMGMPTAFDDKKADFSGITRAEPLYITRVQHKAFVEVNEEGTEAAAATGVVFGTRGAAAPPQVFRADHPFLFLIRDAASGAVLFMGRVANPA